LNLIEAYALTKRFGKLTAVDKLNRQIAQSEYLGISGPNGAGKTTPMQMLSSQLPPQNSGTSVVLGIDAATNPIAVKAAGPYSSTHILELAKKLCTRLGIIDQGKLVAVGWSPIHAISL